MSTHHSPLVLPFSLIWWELVSRVHYEHESTGLRQIHFYDGHSRVIPNNDIQLHGILNFIETISVLLDTLYVQYHILCRFSIEILRGSFE